VLRVGLTGGIGSGKSTAARRFADLGAVLVDSDVLAREAVAPGTDGLAEVVTAFGTQVLGPDGALDRPALAAIVFADPAARERLNAVVHPRVRNRTEELVAAAGPDAIVVQDVPLLVETGSPAAFALVVVVHADVGTRVRRLVEARGMSADDARARIATQADDAARRAAADVWLDNSRAPGDLEAAVDALWHRRLVPFAGNLRDRRPVLPASTEPVTPDPEWASAGARLAERVVRAVGDAVQGAAHVGPTAVPGLPAADVLDVHLALHHGADAADVREALDAAGFPRLAADRESGDRDGARGPGAEWTHAGADPGRAVRVHVSEAGSPAWRAALLRRDWLRRDVRARARYVEVAALPGAAGKAARHRLEDDAVARAEDWAASSGWSPPSSGVGEPGRPVS
jgi:dephospho-CoA kinase